MNRKKLYFDMDGVIVDFKSGIEKLSDEVREKYKDNLDEVPGIFSLMDPMPGAIEAVQLLARHFDVYILSTSPWNNPTAASDKMEWIKKHLNNIFHKRVILSHHKELLQGDYLIDDNFKNGASEFQGEWIHFGSEKYPDWDAVLRYLLM